MKKILVGFLLIIFFEFSMGSCALAFGNHQLLELPWRIQTDKQKLIPPGQLKNGNIPLFNTGRQIPVYIDGEKQVFTQAPVLVNGRVMVPARSIFEAMGIDVDWEASTQGVICKKGNTKVKLSIGCNKAYINDVDIDLTISPRLINGCTYIPLRFVGEAFNATVEWRDGAVYIQLYSNSNDNEDADLEDIEENINDYYTDFGEYYFGDKDIEAEIELSGDEDELTYTIKLDFNDSDEYDHLTDISKADLKNFLEDVNDRINFEIQGTDYEDADITGKLIDKNTSSDYVKYDGDSFTFSWDDSSDISLSDLKSTLNDYFEDAGEDYFDDDGITTNIGLSGDEDDLIYTIKLDFDDASDYDNLSDISTLDLRAFLNAVKTKINSEIRDTDYEDADITGKLIDNDRSRYYVEYNGYRYTYSWLD